MFRLQNYLILSLCGFFLISCSSSKKATFLKSPQSSVIEPSVVIEEAASPIDSVSLTTQVEQVVADVNKPDSLPGEPSPQQKAAELYASGIHKEYDYAQTIHYDWRKPSFVVIHHTSQNSTEQTIRTFQLPHTKVSSHYVIGKDGRVVQMLNDYMRGWHAGKGKWGQITDMNSVSIGIELDNNGFDAFPEVQIEALMVLLDTLKTRYNIPQTNFIGHSDFAPGRKDDPNIRFPWEKLALKGFGIWYNESFLMQPPANFNPVDALKYMGYDTNNLDAVVRSFRKKYLKVDARGPLSEREKAIIYDLFRKYY